MCKIQSRLLLAAFSIIYASFSYAQESEMYNNDTLRAVDYFDQIHQTALFFNTNNYKKGLINSKGKIIIPFEFDSLRDFDGIYAIVSKDNKYGVIDTLGNYIVPLKYDYLKSLANKNVIVKDGDYFGVINMRQQEIIPIIYDKLVSANNYTFLYEKNDSSGILHGNHTTPFNWKRGSYIPFGDSLIIVHSSGGHRIYNIHGKVILDDIDNFDYDELGLLTLVKKGKYILMNGKGKNLYPYKFDYIGQFHNGLARFKLADRFGYFNSKGEVTIPPTLIAARQFKHNKAVIKSDNNRWGIINSNGEFLISPKYNMINFINNTYILSDSLETKLMDHNLVDINANDSIKFYNENKKGPYIKTRTKEKWYLYKSDLSYAEYSKEIIEIKDNLVVTLSDDSNGINLYDSEGKQILKDKYSEYSFKMFAPGILLKKNNYWGYFDQTKNQWLTDIAYEFIFPCYGARAIVVKQNSKYGLLNQLGQVVLEPIYDKISAMTYGVLVENNNKYGLYNKECELLYPIEYDEIDPINWNELKLRKDDVVQIIPWE